MKQLPIFGAFHSVSNADRLYVDRNIVGRGLSRIFGVVRKKNCSLGNT